jgi:8-oxo-dGTP pyrophosphatase MutT (NUDIX family)
LFTRGSAHREGQVAYFDEVIEAAGGVVWRAMHAGEFEVLLVHRPNRNDWSLPKGKRLPRESALDCAVREVREETGLRCTVGDELAQTRYTDRRGRRKRVRYWSMQELEGEFSPNAEVDEVRWTRVSQLSGVLTYPRDLTVVAGLRLPHGAVEVPAPARVR